MIRPALIQEGRLVSDLSTPSGFASAPLPGTCGHPLRGGETCKLRAGHVSPRHASSVFECDNCGRTCRGHYSGHVHTIGYDSCGDPETAVICFLCSRGIA